MNNYFTEELYQEAIKMLDYFKENKNGNVSPNDMQRRLRIGYTLACRIVDRMEEDGLVSEWTGVQPRKVLK
jgi:DNA segregation ATPase FtsK/SpoIIIE-like protein